MRKLFADRVKSAHQSWQARYLSAINCYNIPSVQDGDGNYTHTLRVTVTVTKRVGCL